MLWFVHTPPGLAAPACGSLGLAPGVAWQVQPSLGTGSGPRAVHFPDCRRLCYPPTHTPKTGPEGVQEELGSLFLLPTI